MSQSALTLQELQSVIEKYHQPFKAYTFRPAAYEAIRSQCKPADSLGFGSGLDALRIYKVFRQDADCIEWRDEKALNNYLEAMGEREPKGSAKLEPDGEMTQPNLKEHDLQ